MRTQLSLPTIALFVLFLSGLAGDQFRLIHREIHAPNSCSSSGAASCFYSHRLLSQYDAPESNLTVALRGSTDLGYYFARVFVGTPPQMQTVIVDTGSSVTAIPCKHCVNCGKSHSDPYYNPERSNTSSNLMCSDKTGNFGCNKCEDDKCQFSVSYTEGSSLHGEYMKDQIAFGNHFEELFKSEKQNNDTSALLEKYHEDKASAVFGCTSSETGLFYTQEADGILGLGTKTNSTKHPPNFVDSLAHSGKIPSNSYTLCLADEGGYMTLGGVNSQQHYQNAKMRYIPFLPGEQYFIELAGISMAGVSLKFSPEELDLPRGVFFDSGTTMTHMPPHIRKRMMQYLDEYCSACRRGCGAHRKVRTCYRRDKKAWPELKDFFNTFPDFQFQFSSQVYTWKPEDYLYRQSSDGEEYCLSVFDYPDRIILGASFMRNHDILFDKTHRMIGFVESDCAGFAGVQNSTYQKKELHVKPPRCLGSAREMEEFITTVQTSHLFGDYHDSILVAAALAVSTLAFYAMLRFRRRRTCNTLLEMSEARNLKKIVSNRGSFSEIPIETPKSEANSELVNFPKPEKVIDPSVPKGKVEVDMKVNNSQ